MAATFWSNDPLVRERGGLLAPDHLPPLEHANWEILSELLHEALQQLRATELASEVEALDIQLIDSADINAFVRLRGPHRLIGLSRGLLSQLWNLLVLLLAHPDVLAGSFKHRPTVAPERVTTAIQHQLAAIKAGDLQLALVPDYIKAERLEAATQLYCAILDYIIHHELAHLVRDHAGFLVERFALALVEEKPQGITDKEILRSLNLVEIDADMHGLDMLFERDPEIPNIHRETVESQRRIQFMYTFTHVLVAQFFDLDHAGLEHQLQQSHPPPVYRAILFTRALADSIRHLAGVSREQVRDEHDKAWYEASVCARLLGFPPGRWQGDNMDDVDLAQVDLMQRDYLAFEDLINKRNV